MFSSKFKMLFQIQFQSFALTVSGLKDDPNQFARKLFVLEGKQIIKKKRKKKK